MLKHCYKICYSRRQPMHLWQMYIAFIIIFWYSYETMAKDDNKCNIHCRLLVVLWNQGQWMCLVIIFCFFFTLQKMTISLSTLCHLLFVIIELHKTTMSLLALGHLMMGFLLLQKTIMNLLAHRHLLIFFLLCCNNIFEIIFLEFALKHLI